MKPNNYDVKSIDFTPIQSSNISGAYHDGEDLIIRFVKGPAYVYRNVPVSVFHELLEAGSAGRFFASNIKPNYETERISD